MAEQATDQPIEQTPGPNTGPKAGPRTEAETAGEATRAILRDLWSVMQANEPGMLQGRDTAHLHDYRVALRRIRTVLSRLPGVLPTDAREHFATEFKWLGAVTSPVRDYDVFLEKLPVYATEIEGAESEDALLDETSQRLQRRRDEEQVALVANVESERARELAIRWQAFLDQEPSRWVGRPDAPDAQRPVKDVASMEIRRSYEGSLERAAAITDASPDDEFHELRKDLKKLRYLLEFFRDLFSTDEVDASVAGLKALQDVLGDQNDLSVQRQIVQELVPDDDRDDSVRRLLRYIETSLGQLRRQFHEAFAEFGSDEVRDRFRRLFGPPAQVP